ncbi:MAG: S-methyl-5'-thioadenosine phosphorylase [Deltaproteobacteria bacterium]|nr:MAG: S-methyl-5'-thioadenosine phosphorylase [Deltaproteobacteria bacterium]
MTTVGVIGGSGIYDLDQLQDVEEVSVDTPFGAPSDRYITGRLGGVKMVFLPRHGRGHRILPHEINYRANIYGMKALGVEWLISLSAVGSMREDIRPGDIVLVDQFIDWTRRRPSTFFGDGIAAHVAFGDPVSAPLRRILLDAAREEVAAGGGGERVHDGGTYLVMEGPQFSTRGESLLYRTWGVDVIGMTNMPEAKLAREAEISYATVALATDYDCWREEEEAVTVDAVVAIVRKNAELARRIVARAAARIPAERDCPAATALQNAIMTSPDAISAEVRERLGLLIAKYVR